MGDSVNHWEGLRRQARQAENELEIKLSSFGKIGTGTRELNNSNGHVFEALGMEIEQLLAKLTEINDNMAEYAQHVNVQGGGATLLHTLQRHRDILQDYCHDFQRTRSNIQAQRDRDHLIGSVKREAESGKSGLNRRSDLFVQEKDHLLNSHRLVDEQIDMASATKENLQGQRFNLVNINQQVNAMAARFPVINSLIHRISWKKRKDSIILGLVIASCVLFLLVYHFH